MPKNAIKFAPYGRRTSRSLGRLWQTLARNRITLTGGRDDQPFTKLPDA